MKSRERGAVAVEFALVMPVLLLALLSIVDFGRAMFVQNSLAHAASVSAQALAIRSVDTNTATVGGYYTDTQSAGYLAQRSGSGTGVMGMAGTSTPLLITVSPAAGCPPDGSTNETATVQVTARSPFQWITPIAWMPGEKNSISATATWLCVFTQ